MMIFKVAGLLAVQILGLLVFGYAEVFNEQNLEAFNCHLACENEIVSKFNIVSLSEECGQCLLEYQSSLSFPQLPISYIKDLLGLKVSGRTFVEGWCGKRNGYPNEGVDLTEYPTGWMKTSDGGFTGCEVTSNFPGVNATSHQSHKHVVEEMAKLPKRTNDGSVWRGNELGLLINNELFWKEIDPRSVLLGQTPKQHKVVRPFLDRLYATCDSACEDHLYQSAMEFQRERDEIHVKKDLVQWVHQELFRLTFPGKKDPSTAEEFLALQKTFLGGAAFSQMFPDLLTKILIGSTISKAARLTREYETLVKDIYGKELEGKDCSPSPSCSLQLAAAFLDTLIAAGGLSVPGVLSTGLFVLHGDTAKYGDTFEDVDLSKTNPAAFFLESARFFPPVVGLPWWTKPPPRATDDTASQYGDGLRTIMNLALAQRDPNVWAINGDPTHKFRVRDLQEYHDKFVGFADFAHDKNVANGAMDRVCPGKALSISMGKAWFKAWQQDDWYTDDDISYNDFTPFIGDFTLHRRQPPPHVFSFLFTMFQ